MNRVSSDALRNVVLIGHGASGKTTLTEALLFLSGGSKRRGTVEQGNTVSDYDQEEINRQISINTSLVPCEWKKHKINILDTPGYFDFVSEVIGSLASAEGAVSVVCAVSGVEVGAELTWKRAEELGRAQCVFINKMDRENANFQKVFNQLRDTFGNSVVAAQLPIGAADAFQGVIDLVSMKAYVWDGDKATETAIPDDMVDEAEAARMELIEAAASADDELTMKFLEDEPLTDEEILRGLRIAVRERSAVPVLVGSAQTGVGLPQLLDSIISWMPSPDEVSVEATNAAGESVAVSTKSSGLVARVFKSWQDPYVGHMSLVRVYSGSLKADGTVHNVTKKKDERIAQLFFVRGKEHSQTTEIGAGDIGVIAKLQNTSSGDTLTSREQPLALSELSYPQPTVTMAVHAKEKGDEDKVFSGLNAIAAEDPTLQLEKHPITGESLLSGLGELHLEIALSRLQRRYGVEVELTLPKVPYKETLRSPAHAEYKHKKQTGGRGQYGHVVIDIEPLANGEDFEFVDKIFGGAVPKQYIPAVEKGIRETLEEGVLAGFPIVGVRVTLLDGSAHSVDSSEMAFKLAASMAFKKAFMEANPVLLEPIYNVNILVPDEYMGDVISDLNKKRGRILGMEPQGGMQCVRAQVPQSELFRYGIDLRSITQGRGSFTAEFAQYEEVPANIQEQVLAEVNKADAS